MSLRPKTKKRKTSRPTLSGVKKNSGYYKGKVQGNLIIWEGYSKKGQYQEMYVLGFYPLETRLIARDGEASFGSLAYSNQGGELRVQMNSLGDDKYLTLYVHATSPYGPGSDIIVLNTPENKKMLKKFFHEYVSLARKVRTPNDIGDIIRRGKEDNKKYRRR